MNPAECRNLVQLIKAAGFNANAFVSVFSRVEVELNSVHDVIRLVDELRKNEAAQAEIIRERAVRIIIK